MRVLLVEDDSVISQNISTYLKRKKYSVDSAETIEVGYEKAISDDYDLIVLDRGLPDGDGLELIKKIRDEEINTPILVLTARNEDIDIVEGLNSGADDYLSKPFDMDVLIARMKALSRRLNKIPLKPVIKIDDLAINLNSTEVKRAGKIIKLSPREYAILEYLAIHVNQVVDRMTLLSHAWDENVDMFSNTVDVHVKYLRNKIDEEHSHKLIKTVRGKGYMLCED
jgi:DNA-binding response OmpR family regulator